MAGKRAGEETPPGGIDGPTGLAETGTVSYDNPVASTPGSPDDTGIAKRPRWGRRLAIVGALVILGAGAIGANAALARQRSSPGPQVAIYLAAWKRGDTAAMAGVVDAPPADFAAQVQAFKSALHPAQSRFDLIRVRPVAGGKVAEYHARLDLDGYGPWEYDGELPLVRVAGHWRVKFSPAALHPALAPGLHLALHDQWAARAPILGSDGKPLVTLQEVVPVGLRPTHLKDLNLTEVKRVLLAVLGVPGTAVDRAMLTHVAGKDDFLPVVNVAHDSRWPALRNQLAPVPGITFDRLKQDRVAAGGLSGQVLGTVSEATAERLAQLGGPYHAGLKVGMSGLEKAFETRLAGTPKADIDLVNAAGANVRTLQAFIGAPPLPVTTTLDGNIQRAAETALAGVAPNAAMVVLDATTGAVRAVVNHPGNDLNRAFLGQYPPGSTFKVVTTAAFLEHGATPDTPAPCPATVTVGGRTFKNIETEAGGALSLHTAFAQSCNTSFVGLADSTLPARALADASAQFGFGIEPHLGLTAVGGSVPEPKDPADAAAEAIGQGQITVSPLQMAIVAATVDAGSWHAPSLVVDPPQSASASPATPGSTAQAPPGPPALDPKVADALRAMMAEVVTSGTGTRAAAPGPPVSGKTGTAEFGSGPKPHTHAWFIGFRGKLAFSILLEDGGVGGTDAAPIASRFFTALGRG